MKETKELVKMEQNAVVPVDDADLAAMFGDPMDNLEGTSPKLPKIKIASQGGVFEIEGQEDSTKTITGVILESHRMNSYYREAFSGGNAMPDCWSADGVRPGGEFREAETCAACPMNQFGSALKGGGKACKNGRMVHILIGDDPIPYRMILPPTSIKAWDKYMLMLAGKKRPHASVVTTLTMTKQTNRDGISFYSVEFTLSDLVNDMARLKELSHAVKQIKETIASMSHAEVVQDVASASADLDGNDPF